MTQNIHPQAHSRAFSPYIATLAIIINATLAILHFTKLANVQEWVVPQPEKNWKVDGRYILYWVIVFVGVRFLIRRYILLPFFLRRGVRNALVIRKALEQGYQLIYWTASCAVGLYIYLNSPWAYNTVNLWKGYPFIHPTILFKAYYLIQMAYWIHQSIMVNFEFKRSDQFELNVHHAVTITLIISSWLGNLTPIGNCIFLITDGVDILLCSAKLLRYLKFPGIYSDAIFAVFTIVWIYTRHYLFGILIWRLAYELPKYISYDWNPSQQHFLNRTVHVSWVMFVSILQLLFIVWFFMILRVLYKVLFRGEAADDCREEEDEDESETNTSKKEK